jgi:hypothetical protein
MTAFERLLQDRIIAPVLASATAPLSVKAGVRFTAMCLNRLPAQSQEAYFWDAIRGTQRSRRFAASMAAAGFETFDDIIPDACRIFTTTKSL